VKTSDNRGLFFCVSVADVEWSRTVVTLCRTSVGWLVCLQVGERLPTPGMWLDAGCQGTCGEP